MDWVDCNTLFPSFRIAPHSLVLDQRILTRRPVAGPEPPRTDERFARNAGMAGAWEAMFPPFSRASEASRTDPSLNCKTGPATPNLPIAPFRHLKTRVSSSHEKTTKSDFRKTGLPGDKAVGKLQSRVEDEASCGGASEASGRNRSQVGVALSRARDVA